MANRLDLLKVFVAAAESRNFREAAQRLGASPQVVTRSVRELEEALGEPLFHRSTRGVRLTSFGAALAARGREAVDGVEALFPEKARRDASALGGVVRVAAPHAIGRRIVLAALTPLLKARPDIQLDLRLGEQLADVVAQQIDVGVRIGFLRDNRFVARPVAQVPFAVCASPALVRRTGAPATLDELDERPTTMLIDRNSNRPWPMVFKGGITRLPARPAFVTDDPEAECDAVVAGLAYGQIAAYFAEPLIAARKLVRVLEDHEPEPWTLYVYRPQRAPVPERVRLVHDALVTALA